MSSRWKKCADQRDDRYDLVRWVLWQSHQRIGLFGQTEQVPIAEQVHGALRYITRQRRNQRKGKGVRYSRQKIILHFA